MRRWLTAACAVFFGCGTSSSVTPAPDASDVPDAYVCTPSRAAWDDPPAPLDGGSYRNSLADCWSDATCNRAMVVSHGGDWGADPYDSRGAFVRAVQRGADGIKGDLRVTKDGVAVVTHSSPILFYESPECAGKKIEEMTADEVTCCHMIGSNLTFQRVSDLLAWAHGRTVVMLDVKLATDLPRAITTGIEAGAQDDLFLEVHLQDFLNIVVGSPGWEQLHYLVWLSSAADVDTALAANHTKQGFMYEMDPLLPGLDAPAMKALITTKLHPAGVRAFTSTDKYNPTVQNHQMLFDEGFDVVMTYDLTNALGVRTTLNQSRGVSPP